MKKFLVLILSLALCIMFSLSGCSCVGESILEFNSTQVKDIKTETLSYGVTFEKNYKEIKRASNVNPDILPDYNNGVYITQYETNVSFPDEYTGNLSPIGNVVNRIIASLTVDVVDKKGTDDTSDDKTYKDQIVSEVYFYDSSLSYAPIFSKTTVKNTYIANDETRIQFDHMIYQYTTTYNKDNYVLTKKYYSESEGEDITGQIDFDKLDSSKLISIRGNGRAYEYGFRQVLDNNQLFFATRNIDVSKGNSMILPVVSYMYTNPSKLQFTNSANSIFNVEQSLTYTRPNYSKVYAENALTLPVKNIRITLSDTDYIGMPKYLSVQNGSADEENILNNGLVVEYAEALITANYNCLGALVYKLNNVSITYSA